MFKPNDITKSVCLSVALPLSLSFSFTYFTNLPISLGILRPCPDGPPLVPTYQKASKRRQNYKYITQYNGQSTW